jgi:hypothetical protein
MYYNILSTIVNGGNGYWFASAVNDLRKLYGDLYQFCNPPIKLNNLSF